MRQESKPFELIRPLKISSGSGFTLVRKVEREWQPSLGFLDVRSWGALYYPIKHRYAIQPIPLGAVVHRHVDIHLPHPSLLERLANARPYQIQREAHESGHMGGKLERAFLVCLGQCCGEYSSYQKKIISYNRALSSRMYRKFSTAVSVLLCCVSGSYSFVYRDHMCNIRYTILSLVECHCKGLRSTQWTAHPGHSCVGLYRMIA